MTIVQSLYTGCNNSRPNVGNSDRGAVRLPVYGGMARITCRLAVLNANSRGQYVSAAEGVPGLPRVASLPWLSEPLLLRRFLLKTDRF